MTIFCLTLVAVGLAAYFLTSSKSVTNTPSASDHNRTISHGLNVLLAATIVLSSTAGAAEYVGSWLGEFEEAGEHRGRPYFLQRNQGVTNMNF